MKKFSVTAIVPAYNEEKTIEKILRCLASSQQIDEVVCVNDGSKDLTGDIVKRVSGVTGINLVKNRGKAGAVCEGIKAAKGDIIAMIDADIPELSEENLTTFLKPIQSGIYSVSIGYPCANTLDRICIPFSGERAYFKKDLLPYLDKIQARGYGLELYLNYVFRDKKIATVPLKGIINTWKTEKLSFKDAARLQLKQLYQMGKEIFREPNPIWFFYKAYLSPYYINKQKIPIS